jgi:TolA-binding protein
MKGKTLFGLVIFLLFALLPLEAGTKEELERLQADINALRNQIRELEKAFSEKTDGLKSLVVQLNDQVAESNLILERMGTTLEAQATGAKTTDDLLLEEIQRLSRKMDDTATRVSALAQQLSELKVQSKSYGQTSLLGGGFSPDELFDQANRDFVQGNLDMAIQGFSAYVNDYPGGDRAAAALCIIGDAYGYQNRLPEAIAAFTRVIDEYDDSDKVASALYKRGNTRLAMQDNDAAIEDFKNIVVNFSDSPEAELSKEVLKKLGERIPRAAKKSRR